jgi:hypothetical protein
VLVNESALVLIMVASALLMQVLMSLALARMTQMMGEQNKILQGIVTQLAVMDARQQVNHPNE